METTVVGLYTECSQAESARDALIKARYCRQDVELIPIQKSAMADGEGALHLANGATRTQSHQGHFLFPLMGRWFVDGENEQDYHPEYHADILEEAHRLGGFLLVVQSKNHSQHTEIVNIMDRFNPVEISDRKAHWHLPDESQASQSTAALHRSAPPLTQTASSVY